MPTPISHAAAGFAIAAWAQRPPPTQRVCLVAAACAALPDIDYFGWPVPHRGITHSVAAAFIIGVVATVIFLNGPEWRQSRTRIAVTLALAALSHGLLDGLSTYSFGIEYLAPFSTQRFRLWWTPLGDPQGRLGAQLTQDAIVVLLPAVLLGWLAFRRGRDRRAKIAAA